MKVWRCIGCMLQVTEEFPHTGSWPYVSPSVLWQCWFGDRKGMRPVKSWVLVCRCDDLTAAKDDGSGGDNWSCKTCKTPGEWLLKWGEMLKAIWRWAPPPTFHRSTVTLTNLTMSQVPTRHAFQNNTVQQCTQTNRPIVRVVPAASVDTAHGIFQTPNSRWQIQESAE